MEIIMHILYNSVVYLMQDQDIPDRLKKLMPVDSYGMICLLCYFMDLSQKFFMPSTIRKRLYIDWN